MKVKLLFIFSLLAFSAFGQKPNIEQALKFVLDKVKASCIEVKDSTRLPRNVPPGGNHWSCVGPHDWTSGFFPGILWYTYEFSKDPMVKKHAEKWTDVLSDIQYHDWDHDIGFMMYCSYGNALRITRDKKYEPYLVQSAKTMMHRYKQKMGVISSWDHLKSYGYFYPVIIDNMMNLELWFWASKATKDPIYKQCAISHADKTAANHFREDYTTFHVVDYDTATAQVNRKFTWQGYQNTSVWARGQSWAIYGFTFCYRETKDLAYLEKAKAAADWYLAHLPEDGIPYWDFNAPYIPNEEKDASAAAITASALLELSSFLPASERMKYFTGAEKMLYSLSENYTSKYAAHNAILEHSVGGKTFNGEVNYAINYADYYYIEALLRYKNSKLRIKQ